jgi:hypothetical protein
MEERKTFQGKEIGPGDEATRLEQQHIRTERALSMLGEGQIRFQANGTLGWLALDREGGVRQLRRDTCDCEDFSHRCRPLHIRCKHLEALRIAAGSFSSPDHPDGTQWDPRLSAAGLMRLLQAPFPAQAVHWKPQKVSSQGNRALAVAYIDAREVAGRLDEVVGPLGWQVVHQILGDQVVTGIGIRDPSTGSWVWKWDSGFVGKQQDDNERGSAECDPRVRHDDEQKARKGTLSDGLKRAAVLWGIGRYLYRLPKVWVPYDPKSKSLADIPLLPSWALPCAPREPRARSSEEQAIPASEPTSGSARPARQCGGCDPASAQASGAGGHSSSHPPHDAHSRVDGNAPV